MDSNDRVIANVGPFQVDVPQSLGYFSGIAAAAAFGFLEPLVAVFIAAVPVLKMRANPAAAAVRRRDAARSRRTRRQRR